MSDPAFYFTFGYMKTPTMTDLQYAELLLQFVQPIMSEMPDMEELEEKLNIGLTAWNLAVIKQNDAEFYKEYSKNLLSELAGKGSRQQIGKLIQNKNKQYATHNVMLTGCEIAANKKNEAVVNVQSKTYEQFVQELLKANMNEPDEETGLNRTAIAVIPRRPFTAWLKKNRFALTANNTLYLIDALENEKSVEKWLKKNFDSVFSNELNEWAANEQDWPKKRTYKMFSEWFDVKICSVIYDLGTSPLIKE